jgi:hypothetical protein
LIAASDGIASTIVANPGSAMSDFADATARQNATLGMGGAACTAESSDCVGRAAPSPS